MSARLLLLRAAGAGARTTTTTPVSISRSLVAAQRSLSQTTTRNLKESSSQDPNPEDFEHHKQDSLSKQKRGQGHWKPELASVSEETVKADRMTPGEAGEAALKRLQEQTKHHAEETRKAGTSMKDNM
ncbi:hypothetical protein QBC47DRAFT_216357 [Echria macrotheca]|uniref:Uncharacterized protein n=1 Tax=Echria macrotheca TaxID=438768 RepID=A0AAJ0B9U3_9PEZI|nr:hypothetical protein QBC47DRAFT_216357 [Echria macrotheca]